MTGEPGSGRARLGWARPLEVIAVPSNLGLRPPSPGHEPGTWRAPEAMISAGLATRLEPARVVELARPPYDFERQPVTNIRNGLTIREHGLELAAATEAVLSAGRFALVLGGDCSILLGCLAGARRGGPCGLVHVDGHMDFFHPGNYDVESRLGSAAGMDLALATGRGEPLLTQWPGAGTALVSDDDTIQVGDREAEGPPEGTTGTLDPSIIQFTVQEIHRRGPTQICDGIDAWLDRRGLDRIWVHADLDVLDQEVLPAVDSPGSPGLDFAQLAELLSRLLKTGRAIGLDVTIYDPELDPEGVQLPDIVGCIETAVAAIPTPDDRSRRP
jgi:arginase